MMQPAPTVNGGQIVSEEMNLVEDGGGRSSRKRQSSLTELTDLRVRGRRDHAPRRYVTEDVSGAVSAETTSHGSDDSLSRRWKLNAKQAQRRIQPIRRRRALFRRFKRKLQLVCRCMVH